MNYLDLFSGCGGFRRGLEEAGYVFEWEGHSEIDKYANQIYEYHYPESEALGNVKAIRSDELPELDLITFGFPCQDLSNAGKGKGLRAARSGLFFEAMRVVRAKRPRGFVFENVMGLFSKSPAQNIIDKREWLLAILREVADAGYDGQWQVLDTRWFLPQARERIYFVGYPRAGSRPEIFPIEENDRRFTGAQEEERGRGERIRGDDSRNIIANTVRARCYKDGSENLIQIGNVDTKDNNSIWGRVYDPEGIACTLNAEGGGLGAKTGLYDVRAVIGIDRPNKGQHGRRFKEDGEPMFTLTSRDRYGVEITRGVTDNSRGMVARADELSGTLRAGGGGSQTPKVVAGKNIRRLTPLECERLQGFPDNWTAVGTAGPVSDSQRYKMIGNAASVPPVKATVEKMKGLLFD